MGDYRQDAISTLRNEYDAGEYAERVLDFLVAYTIFTDTGQSYLYNSEYFTMDKDAVKRIITTIQTLDEE